MFRSCVLHQAWPGGQAYGSVGRVSIAITSRQAVSQLNQLAENDHPSRPSQNVGGRIPFWRCRGPSSQTDLHVQLRSHAGAGFTLRWNVDCEAPDMVGSNAFYLCGQGAAFAKGDTISGVLVGGYRPFCTSGSHSFVFQRRH